MSEKTSSKSPRAKRDSSPGAQEVTPASSEVSAPPAAQPAPQEETVPSPAGLVHQPPTAQASIVPVKQPVEDEFGGEGEGFEGFHPTDNVMPAVAVMQGQSPEVKQSNGKIKDGDFLIKTTGQHFDGKKGFLFVVCGVKRAFNLWNNRNDESNGQTPGNGKGFIREYADGDSFVEKLTGGQKIFGPIAVNTTPGQATSLVETKTLFGLLIDEETGQYQLATIPCSSSKINAYNNTTSTIRTFRLNGRKLNIYNFIWRVTTAQKQKKGTNHYYANLQLDPAYEPFTAKDTRSLLTKSSNATIFEVARQLTQDIAAQRVKAETHVDDAVDTSAGGEDTGDADGGRHTGTNGKVGSDKIPF